MTADKAAELAVQIVLAAIQNGKLDAGSPELVGKYYDDMYCLIMTSEKKEEAELLAWRIKSTTEDISKVQQ